MEGLKLVYEEALLRRVAKLLRTQQGSQGCALLVGVCSPKIADTTEVALTAAVQLRSESTGTNNPSHLPSLYS